MESNEEKVKQIINEVYDILEEMGYNPISQLTGYILSEDPSYICTYKDARKKISEVLVDDIVEVLLKEFKSK